MKLSDLKTSDEVLSNEMRDPTFRAEWERTALARALAVEVLAYRTEHNLSQRAMAKRLGMSQPQVARIEAATHSPAIETIARVAVVIQREFRVTIYPRDREPTLQTKRVRTTSDNGTAGPMRPITAQRAVG
jgi:transcriptional regulator with XRE-family HTH domain